MSSKLRGSGGGGGGGGKGGGGQQQARSPQEAPDSLFSRSVAKIVIALGEGEQDGFPTDSPLKAIFLDDTPIMRADGSMNFSTGVTVDSRDGTLDQTPIEGYSTIGTTTSVGVEVQQPTPVTRTYSGSGVGRIRVIIQVPQLVAINASNGDTNPTSFQFRIAVSTDGGPFVTVAEPVVSGKASGQFQRAYEFAVTGSVWDVRLTRLTADSSSSLLVNAFFWQATVLLVERRLSYPGTALLACTIDASEFSAIPAIAVKRRGNLIQVPSNYNPVTRTYSGIWDGTFSPTLQWTDNPAWIFYDLVTNSRYGLGRYIDTPSVDKWELYAISQYCDELVDDFRGGTEPRFTCNVFLQSLGDAAEVVSSLASVFRGLAYYASGTLAVSQDKPGTPVRQYSPANVIEERDDSGNVTSPAFSYSSTSRRARKTVAFVTWDDPDNRDQATVEVVQDDEALQQFGFNPLDLRLIGCTSRGQAIRAGKWALLTNQLETDTVSFRVSLEGASVRPGEIIQVSDPLRTDKRWAGRLQSGSTTTSLVLDEAHDLGTGPWTISVVNAAAGSGIETVNLQAPADGEYPISPALTFTPLAGTVYVIESATRQARQYRVISVAEQDPGIFQIQALQYRSDKYAAVESGDALVDPLDRFTIRDVNPVTGLSAQLVYNNGSVYIRASWTPPQFEGYADPQVTEYRVEYQQTDSNLYRLGGEVRGTSADILLPDFVYGQQFSLRVAARNGLSQQSRWTTVAVADLEALPDISTHAYGATVTHVNQPDGSQLIIISPGSTPLPDRVSGYRIWAKPGNDLVGTIPGVKDPEADGFYRLNDVPLTGYYAVSFHAPATYTVRVALLSAVQGEGAGTTYIFDTVARAEIVPPTPERFTVVQNQGRTGKRFSWGVPVPAFGAWDRGIVTDIVSFQVRYKQGGLGSLTVSQAWDVGLPLFSGGVPATQQWVETTLFDNDEWVVMLKAVDQTGWSSDEPAYILVNTQAPLTANVVATGALDIGTSQLVNCTSSGVYGLGLESGDTLLAEPGDGLLLEQAGAAYLLQTDVSQDAYVTWTFDNNDLDSALLLTTSAAATYAHDIRSLTGLELPLLLESGSSILMESGSVVLTEDYDTSALSTSALASTVWHPYAPMEQLSEDQYAVRTRFRSLDGTTPGELYSVNYKLDYADILESINDVATSAGADTTVALTRPFTAVTGVQSTLQANGGSAVAVVVVSRSPTSIVLRTINSSGTRVAGLVDLTVQGY